MTSSSFINFEPHSGVQVSLPPNLIWMSISLLFKGLVALFEVFGPSIEVFNPSLKKTIAPKSVIWTQMLQLDACRH